MGENREHLRAEVPRADAADLVGSVHPKTKAAESPTANTVPEVPREYASDSILPVLIHLEDSQPLLDNSSMDSLYHHHHQDHGFLELPPPFEERAAAAAVAKRDRYVADHSERPLRPQDHLHHHDDDEDVLDTRWTNVPLASATSTSSTRSDPFSASSFGGGADSHSRRRRSRQRSYNAARSSSRQTPISEVPESGGLRASLDAGMASVRRWVRSRTTTTRHAARCDDEPDETDQEHSTRPRFNSRLEEIDLEAWGGDGQPEYDRSSVLSQDFFAPQQQQLHQPHQQHISRQRTFSESDAARINADLRMRRRRRRSRAFTEDTVPTVHLSSTAAAALSASSSSSSRHYLTSMTALDGTNTNIPTAATDNFSNGGNSGRLTTNDPNDISNNNNNNSTTGGLQAGTEQNLMSENRTNNNNNNNNTTVNGMSPDSDPERRARMRWIRINRRFQLVITMVALLFSLLLFSILICWVVLTSAYVVSFDKSCDVPLKPYFWLVTLQLILDVFRSDIMRFVFRWDSNSNQRIPCRVVVYNLAYLLYAMMVLRLGIRSVFLDGNTCRKTAPELFNASAAFVSLSLTAWATIICGYLLPFCVVAIMLTCNGYNPAAAAQTNGTGAGGPAQPVFPAAYSSAGAPPGCIEMIPVLAVPPVSEECSICMEEFRRTDVVVETGCKHLFHKQCCRDWLLQARSCPICRTDIPSALMMMPSSSTATETTGTQSVGTTGARANPPQQIPVGPTGRPVVGLLRMLHPGEQSSLGTTTTTTSNPSSTTTTRLPSRPNRSRPHRVRSAPQPETASNDIN